MMAEEERIMISQYFQYYVAPECIINECQRPLNTE